MEADRFRPKNDCEIKDDTKTTREKILEQARKAVCGDRDLQYGSPEKSFDLIAQYWSVYLGQELKPTDVAALMILFKVARQQNGSKPDNWVDIAGYSACGAEIDEKENAGNDWKKKLAESTKPVFFVKGEIK